jgi:CRISPR/Cas system CSM-associated protein Csm3 (group 7 of RAMP superfamily)
MILLGKLFVESPLYRGHARKTLFTRDGDGTQRLVSLAGEVGGTAQFLMDAFIGGNDNNIGLLPRLWLRLYGSPMPEGLITRLSCNLQEESYPRDHFFDLRMGIKLDEDRWASEANANYKMETLYRNSVFDIEFNIRESVLEKGENSARLYYILQELKDGRFWFGAGKSRGLGRCRLEVDLPLPVPETPPSVTPGANHLTISLTFKAINPILVGWNWGKIDPAIPAFADIEGRSLIESMRNIPEPIRDRLAMIIGAPILSPEDWKNNLAEYLPRVIAIWLRERSSGQAESYVFPSSGVAKLSKGKYALASKLLDQIMLIADQPFESREEAESALNKALGKKANMAKRVLEILEFKSYASQKLNNEAWIEIANGLGLDPDLSEKIASQIKSESALVEILALECKKILPDLYQQTDRQVRLLESDPWIDTEIAVREEHIRIKNMLISGEITEEQWNNPDRVKGVKVPAWKEFLNSHSQMQFKHMVSNTRNLKKSITNDSNFIAFLNIYRDYVRQELAQTYNTDFRDGGISNRERSRKYGKPYDKVFMRMLSWSPSSQVHGSWEIYIPGSTIKGAFRKRASQVLKTLWGESSKTNKTLERLFGSQRHKGLVFFSDAYLMDPIDSERSWCSMDGVRMNPQTGRPIEDAKSDYLFAYGDNLSFNLRMDIQDISKEDLEAISLMRHLLQDFQRGDIPIGGEKSNGFGWIESSITGLNWLATDPDSIGEELFGKQSFTPDGVWHRLDLDGELATKVLQPVKALVSTAGESLQSPPRSDLGFISHRAFGGYCGTMMVEAEILTPTSIQESGEPSFLAILEGLPVHGWDFFSMSPPEEALRNNQRAYALPSKSIKGMIRHIYSIASDSSKPSTDIRRLNPADSLFGWIGTGPNQAIMGRVSFSFGMFDDPKLDWFKVPYPYGEWQYNNNQWKTIPEGLASNLIIGKNWRVFPHVPLTPIVEKLDGFHPDTPQANYMRAILPGSRCNFNIRFWNLNEQELQRLLWCLMLEQELAHKIGKERYLGMGSLRLRVLPDSFLIDWKNRYSGKQDWQRPINVEEWINTKVIAYYNELKKALDTKSL